MSNPEFIILCGAMFSSKTTMLLSTLERYRYQKKNVLVLKPELDGRYANDAITSHCGWQIAAETVITGQDILDKVIALEVPPDVVALDEAFMIPGCADALIWLFKQGVSIVVSTLDLSAIGKPFKEPKEMMPWATVIKKCSAVCTICGSNAPYTHKKFANENEIQVGGEDMYEPRCFSHHVAIDERDR